MFVKYPAASGEGRSRGLRGLARIVLWSGEWDTEFHGEVTAFHGEFHGEFYRGLRNSLCVLRALGGSSYVGHHRSARIGAEYMVILTVRQSRNAMSIPIRSIGPIQKISVFLTN